jgi:truncated hemoglobin YjbI
MNEGLLIQEIVRAFYEKAKNDVMIGYHFRNIQDFDEHIPRIIAFWEIQLLGKTQQEVATPFDVLKAHIPLAIKKGELGRWLLLFRKTIDEKTLHHSEFSEFNSQWKLKLTFFEDTFLRFFRL